MKVHDGFVIDPDSRLIPFYRISPFTNKAAAINRTLKSTGAFGAYFNQRFPNYNWQFTMSGREALQLALSDIGPERFDNISILTTTGNFYISGCVTSEIEKFCNWNRQPEPNTKAILVNHEFGFPFEALKNVGKCNLPVIEDCAHSFLSQNREGTVGTVGDYLIFSLPKFFPIQFGGIYCRRKSQGDLQNSYKSIELQYISNALDHYVHDIDSFADARKRNFRYFYQKFAEHGWIPRFLPEEHHTPGVFMFTLKEGEDGQGLKTHLQRNGVEASVFYKENAVFIPVHHMLKMDDMDYIYSMIVSYFNL